MKIINSTSINISRLLTANVFSNVVNFTISIIVAKIYGNTFFANYSVAVNIAFMAATIMDFGMNITMVRLYKKHEDTNIGYEVLFVNKTLKILLLFVVVGIGYIGKETLALLFFKEVSYDIVIMIALCCGGIIGLWDYLKAYCQALEVFRFLSILIFMYGVLRFVMFYLSTIMYDKNSVVTIINSVYIIPLIIVVLAGTWVMHNNNRMSHNYFTIKKTFLDMICYARWVAMSIFAFNFMNRLLVLLAAYYCSSYDVSLLTSALVFIGVYNLINASVRQVLFPQIAEISKHKIYQYINTLKKYFILYISLSVMAMTIASYAIYYILGETYHGAISLLWIVGMGTSITTFVGYYNILCHSINKPQIEATYNVIRLIAFIMLSIVITPIYGLKGLVLTYVIVCVCGEIYLALTLKNKIKEVYL